MDIDQMTQYEVYWTLKFTFTFSSLLRECIICC